MEVSNYNSSELPEGFYTYLETLASSIQAENSEDDLEVFEKCLSECEGHEETLLLSRDGSKYLEQIFGRHPIYSLRLLERIGRLKKKKILNLICSRCGSRVFETLLYSVKERFVCPKDSVQEVEEVIRDLLSVVTENWADLSGDTYGSHVIRTLGRVLCGLGRAENSVTGKSDEPGPTNKRQKMTEEEKPETSQTEFMKNSFSQLETLALDWKLMSDYLNMESVSLLMQDFVSLSKMVNKGKQLSLLVQSILETETEVVWWMLTDKQASRFCESIIIHSTDDEMERIFQMFIQDELKDLAIHPISNFPIQRLLERAKTEELMTDIMEQLEDNLKSIIGNGRIGILISLSSAMKRFPDFLPNFYKKLMKGFDCWSPKNRRKWILPCVLTLKTFSDLQQTITGISSTDTESDIQFPMDAVKYQGSILGQNLLSLKKNTRILKSFCQIHKNTVIELCCHVSGSHFMELILTSEGIPSEKRTEILETRLKGSWSHLCSDKYGSRVFDAVWKSVNMKDKCAIMEELAKNSSSIEKSGIGAIISKKYGIQLFKKSVKEWRNTIANADKKRKMLSNFV